MDTTIFVNIIVNRKASLSSDKNLNAINKSRKRRGILFSKYINRGALILILYYLLNIIFLL